MKTVDAPVKCFSLFLVIDHAKTIFIDNSSRKRTLNSEADRFSRLAGFETYIKNTLTDEVVYRGAKFK